MELLVVLIVGTPLIVGIWLIARAFSAQHRIEELNRRVDELQAQIIVLSQQSAAPTEPASKSAAPDAPDKYPARAATIPDPGFAVEPTPTVDPDNLPSAPATVPPLIPPLPQILPYGPLMGTPVPPPIPAETEIPPLIPQPKTSLPIPLPMRAQANEDGQPDFATAPAPEKASFEMRLGTFWLVRIGVVMLLTGLVFFGNYAYHNLVGLLGPGGKVSLLYAASGLLLGAGLWWQRRVNQEGLRNYAQVLFAGGLAAVYFTTYAAYYIPALHIIGNPVLDGTLLFLWAGVITWIANRRQSEIMALFGVGLAFYSSVITRVGDFTLYSNLVLTITAVVFLLRNRWVNLSFAGLVTSYAGYTFWRFLHEDGWRWATPNEGLNFGAAFLLAYWIIFTAATFLSRHEKLSGANRAAFLTLNNSAFFALFLLTMIQVHSGGFWKFSLGYGTLLLALAGLAQKRLPAETLTRQTYLVQGLLLVTLGFISKFSGLQLSLVLGVESVILFLLGSQLQSHILKLFGAAIAALATGWCLVSLKPFAHPGLWTGISLGGFMMINTFCAHRKDAGQSVSSFRADPTFFTLLAFAAWLATTWFNTTTVSLPATLAVEALALTLSFHILRIKEIPLLGQSFLVLAQFAALYNISNATPPWWSPLSVIVITIGLSHWWQKQKSLVVHEMIGLSCQTIFAVAVIAWYSRGRTY